jgi:hypothetical protein
VEVVSTGAAAAGSVEVVVSVAAALLAAGVSVVLTGSFVLAGSFCEFSFEPEQAKQRQASAAIIINCFILGFSW